MASICFKSTTIFPFRPTWPIVFSIAPLLQKSKSRIQLGSGVTVPYLIHPGLIATHIACLEEQSGQRAFVVLGRGAFPELFDTQIPHPVSALRESALIIDNLMGARKA